MNSKLRDKILTAIFKATPRVHVQARIAKQLDKDLILPILNLNSKTKVSVDVTKDYINLYVGPRDFQFNAKTGTLEGSGCIL